MGGNYQNETEVESAPIPTMSLKACFPYLVPGKLTDKFSRIFSGTFFRRPEHQLRVSKHKRVCLAFTLEIMRLLKIS
jgi:hypothetical protein